jgi:hypothetical protein
MDTIQVGGGHSDTIINGITDIIYLVISVNITRIPNISGNTTFARYKNIIYRATVIIHY